MKQLDHASYLHEKSAVRHEQQVCFWQGSPGSIVGAEPLSASQSPQLLHIQGLCTHVPLPEHTVKVMPIAVLVLGIQACWALQSYTSIAHAQMHTQQVRSAIAIIKEERVRCVRYSGVVCFGTYGRFTYRQFSNIAAG